MKTESSSRLPDELAIEALVYLAGDPELLSRFLALTGIAASDIRQAAQEPRFLAGVLQFFLSHEPTLMRFCADKAIDPAAVEAAYRSLPGGAQLHE